MVFGSLYNSGYNSNNLMTIRGNGNVGIGTISPAQKLQVIGNAIIGANSNSSVAARLDITAGGSGFDSVIDFGFFDTFDAGIWNIGRKGSTGTFFISNFSTGTEVNVVTINSSNNNFGIGTTNPQARLDVSGSVYVRTSLATDTIVNYTGGGIPLTIGTGGSQNVVFNTVATERMRIDTSGRVGIGTISPATTLHVAGGMARTNTRVSSDEVYPIGHYTPGETVFEINTTWNDAELQEYFNSANVSWTSSADAPGGYAIYINGEVNVGGEYNSGFPYIPVDQDDVFYMECWIRNVGTNQAHYMGSMDYNHNLTSLGGNPGTYGYWVMSNTNPTNTWTKVSGYIKGFGSSTGQFVAGTKYWTPQALFNYTAGTGTRACAISGWKVIKVNAMGNRFFSGSVGIGTTSPAWKLDVNGSIGLSGFRFAINSGTYNIIYEPAGNAAIYLGNATDPSNYYDNTAHWWRTRGGGTVNMYLNSTGLGIGTNSPAGKLHLSGSDAPRIALIAGSTKATRIGANSAGAIIEGVDYTGVGSYQPLYVGGSTVTLTTSNVDRWVVNASGHFVAATDGAYDIGVSGATRPRNVFAAGAINATSYTSSLSNQVGYFGTASFAVSASWAPSAGSTPQTTTSGGPLNIYIAQTFGGF
jgi:hypothetical protein